MSLWISQRKETQRLSRSEGNESHVRAPRSRSLLVLLWENSVCSWRGGENIYADGESCKPLQKPENMLRSLWVRISTEGAAETTYYWKLITDRIRRTSFDVYCDILKRIILNYNFFKNISITIFHFNYI